MEAELRNFQATVFSLCGSGIVPFQHSKSHNILYAEAELQNFKSQYIPCAEAELQAKEYSMCGSRTKSHNSLCAEAELQVYVEYLWFFMQESEVPGSAGPKTPVSKPFWRCCSQLCHLGGGPYWDCFSYSVFIKLDRIS